MKSRVWALKFSGKFENTGVLDTNIQSLQAAIEMAYL